jgi:hypothetical protein
MARDSLIAVMTASQNPHRLILENKERLIIGLSEAIRAIADKNPQLEFSSELYFARVRKRDPDPRWLIVEQRDSLSFVYYYGEWVDGRPETGNENELRIEILAEKVGFSDGEYMLSPEQVARTLLAPLISRS